jgi:hypothetical protein
MSSWSSSTHTVSEMESHDISALITLSGAPLPLAIRPDQICQ